MSSIIKGGMGIAAGGLAVAGSATIIPLTPILILAGILGGTVVAVAALGSPKGSNFKTKAIAKIQTSKGVDKFYVQSLTGDYCSAELSSDCRLTCNRKVVREWECFEMLKTDDGRFAFQASNQKYISADRDKGGLLIANRDQIDDWELFTMEERADCFVSFKASNGKYVSRTQADAALKAIATSIGEAELFRVLIIKDHIAMKDSITITKTIEIKRTVTVNLGIHNYKEIVEHHKGWFMGTIFNWFFSGKAEEEVRKQVKQQLEAELKSQIEDAINKELDARLTEEATRRIKLKLKEQVIEASVVTTVK